MIIAGRRESKELSHGFQGGGFSGFRVARVRGIDAPELSARWPSSDHGRYAANTAAVYSRVKVAANASSWPLSALRMADLISGLSSRAGPVILQSAKRRTRVP